MTDRRTLTPNPSPWQGEGSFVVLAHENEMGGRLRIVHTEAWQCCEEASA